MSDAAQIKETTERAERAGRVKSLGWVGGLRPTSRWWLRLLGLLCMAGLAGACTGGQVIRVTPRPIGDTISLVATAAPDNTATRPPQMTATTAAVAPSPATPMTRFYTPTPVSGMLEIKVGDYYFDPPVATITVGTTVVWRPVGDLQHTIDPKEPTNAFRNGYTAGLGSPNYDWTFKKPGTIFYHCAYHPGAMDAILYVVD